MLANTMSCGWEKTQRKTIVTKTKLADDIEEWTEEEEEELLFSKINVH